MANKRLPLQRRSLTTKHDEARRGAITLCSERVAAAPEARDALRRHHTLLCKTLSPLSVGAEASRSSGELVRGDGPADALADTNNVSGAAKTAGRAESWAVELFVGGEEGHDGVVV